MRGEAILNTQKRLAGNYAEHIGKQVTKYDTNYIT